MRRVYLDHGATTPVHPAVIEAMVDCMQNHFGNPSSVHSFGREAKKLLEEARAKVAHLIGARPEEIIFTSGGTEADNLTIFGVARAMRKKGNHVITSAAEHHAVLDACQALTKEGFEVTVLPVDKYGMVRVEDVKAALKPETVLVTIMHANNEVGTINPIKEITQLVKAHGAVMHTDAVQTVGKIPVDVNDLGVDLLSLSSHKIYGPKGVGALYIRKGTKLFPLSHGGGQERKRRPGTENLPGIVGFGKAAEIMARELPEEMGRMGRLRQRLIEGLLAIPEVQLNGHPTERIPINVNVSIKYIEGESLLLMLDMKGIAASSGSACTSGSLDPSHVLLAMGICHEVAHGSLRLTLGRDNTEEDIEYVLDVLPPIVERLRAMSPLYANKEG
ncbi:cysteine desulfurase family protein [Heliomicrobium modesticaldum Ice1]|uniref:Cysteine desulfurase IscS n=1 Tax=Heliobacterium modesticaldum (strain ATCC 51547 / Ice1) TaxID=498761 RepID=B0TFA5_HELMI|nr:cysteine desulfurase NifS [Heliomicrobium modesticaldum]ABZ84422.1 cysteine desulfurase family protein [Heliomicrobium modesticaldum Ice1]